MEILISLETTQDFYRDPSLLLKRDSEYIRNIHAFFFLSQDPDSHIHTPPWPSTSGAIPHQSFGCDTSSQGSYIVVIAIF